jgi:hypothetical protein
MKPEIILTPQSFPSSDISESQKDTPEFGLRIGQAIQHEWFNKDGGSCRYYSQRAEFHRLRLYARGNQPIGKYKKEMSVDGDLSYMNLNWDVVPIIPKFVDIVVNGMSERGYKIKATAQDSTSAEKKNLFQDMVEADMVAKEFLLQTQQQFGINAFNVDPKELPQSDDEMSLYMELKYKPSIEIAEEIALDTVLELNDFKLIQSQIDKDQVEIGVSFVSHDFQKGNGVVITYEDPAKMVWSYTEKPDFSDCFYFGKVDTVHYTELLKIKPDLTSERLAELRVYGTSWLSAYPEISKYQDDIFSKDTVTLLHFNYLMDKRFVYKNKKTKIGGNKIIKKDSSFSPEENENFEVIDILKPVWYTGIMVAGTNEILKWEMSTNMVRPKSPSNRPLPNFIGFAPRMYKGNIDSLVKRMIPFADSIQLDHLKLQQIKARIVPDGVFIDADGINEVDLGSGAAYNPEDALKLYFQTGSVVGRSYTEEGGFNNGRVPIQELNSSGGQSKIQGLIASYNFNLNMIRDVTGLNEARDGSMPNEDSLVGLQKLAALNSNTATKHVLDGRLMTVRRLALCLSLRVADILEYASFKEQFAMQIGKYNIAILEDIKNLYLHDFGISIDLEPDQEQKDALERDIQISLQRDQIFLEDAIDIRGVKNIKLANEVLKLKRRRKMEDSRAREDQQAAQQAEINAQSQQAATSAKKEQIQMEAEAKMQVKQNEVALDIQRMGAEVEYKRQLMKEEFDYNMQLKGLEVEGINKKEKEKEDRKDKRVDLEATRQSDLIEQRQNNLPAKSFESTNDNFDAFDFSAFGPK